MSWPRAGAASTALGEAIRRTLDPAGACDPDARQKLDEESWESNARVLYWLAHALVPLCAVTVIIVLRQQEIEPARSDWRLGVLVITLAFGAFSLPMAVVAKRRKPVAAWRALADGWGSVGLVGAAAMSANAQRAHPNLNIFVISVFAAAFFLRMKVRSFALAVVLGAGLIIVSIEHFQPDPAGRRVDELAVLLVSSLALLAFLLTGSMRVGIFRARQQVEVLNRELERRVDVQVGEIRRRAREVDELNTQLNEKVLERSRELSIALARLANDEEAMARGRLLGGRVEIEGWLGSGGMGVVYRGRDQVTNKTVAVKVAQAGSASELDGLHRFLREAEALATVSHPAIVRSIHVDVSEDGQLFQMMELVEGESLDAHLARVGRMPWQAAARVGAVLAGALASAHAASVVHRDVKPSNVMLTASAPGLKLLDFGISIVARAGGDDRRGDALVGTPEFIAPEQVTAPATVGAAADVYAFGLTIYLSVAGRLPFAAETSREWFVMHLVDDPVELTTLAPDVDPTLARAVMQCLAKEPEARPTAAELAETFAKVADAAGTPSLEDLGLAAEGQTPPSMVAPRPGSRTTVARIAIPALALPDEAAPRTPDAGGSTT